MSFSVLTSSLEILRIAEATIASEVGFLKKYRGPLGLVRPLNAMCNGMTVFLGPAIKFIVCWVGGLLLIAVATKIFSITPSGLNTLHLATVMFSFIFSAFAMPSSYVADGISEAHVREVVSRIRADMLLTETEVGVVEKTINDFQERALSRINAFQWMLAATWALVTYLFSQYAGFAAKLFPANGAIQQVLDAGMQLFVFAFISLLILWAVFGYKRSIDMTFTLSRLALRQVSLELASAKQNEHGKREQIKKSAAA